MSGSATFTIVMSSRSMNTRGADRGQRPPAVGVGRVLGAVAVRRLMSDDTVRRATCSGMTQRHPTTPPQAPGPSGARPTVRPVLVRDFTDGQEVDQPLLVRAAEVRVPARRLGVPAPRPGRPHRAAHGDGVGRRRGAQGALHGRRGGPRRRAPRGPPALGRAARRAGGPPAGRGQLRLERPARRAARPGRADGARPARPRRHRPGPAPAGAARRASSGRAPRPGSTTAARRRPRSSTRPTRTACSSTR